MTLNSPGHVICPFTSSHDTQWYFCVNNYKNILLTFPQLWHKLPGRVMAGGAKMNLHQKLPTHSDWVLRHQWKQSRQSPTDVSTSPSDVDSPLVRLSVSWCLVVIDERFKPAIRATISYFLRWQISCNGPSGRHIKFKAFSLKYTRLCVLSVAQT